MTATSSSAPRVFVAVLVAVFVSWSPSAAQETPFATERALESRVRELEEAVRRLGEAKAGPVAANSPKAPVLAGWDNGFILRSPDDQFKLRITGQLQSDYRGYLDGATANCETCNPTAGSSDRVFLS